MVRQLAIVVAVAGCYHAANETACTVTCGDGVSCPDGLTCVGGLCRASADDTCSGLPTDATGSSTPDGPCTTFGTGLFTYAACPPPDATAISMPALFDTDNACTGDPHYRTAQVGGRSVCVVVGTRITVSALGLTAYGSQPLVLAANDLEITGSIDVSGHFGSMNGAGSGFGCSGGPNDGTTGGGGAGGAAGGAGGAGGKSEGTSAPAPLAEQLSELRGGCAGGAGDHALTSGTLGNGGPGGGAIYLIGRTQLYTAANIKILAAGARGEGGTGALSGLGGGGGGGAGGLIALDSPNPMINLPLTLCANGGGGGGGGNGSTSSIATGTEGVDGCKAYPATGGNGSNNGGAGGNGNDRSPTIDGKAGADELVVGAAAGGGGGGGAGGYIRIYGDPTLAATLNANATVSPPAQ